MYFWSMYQPNLTTDDSLITCRLLSNFQHLRFLSWELKSVVNQRIKLEIKRKDQRDSRDQEKITTDFVWVTVWVREIECRIELLVYQWDAEKNLIWLMNENANCWH